MTDVELFHKIQYFEQECEDLDFNYEIDGNYIRIRRKNKHVSEMFAFKSFLEAQSFLDGYRTCDDHRKLIDEAQDDE